MSQIRDDHSLSIIILKMRKLRHEGVKFREHTGVFIHNCFLDLFSKFSSVDLCVSLSLYRTVSLGWHLSHCLQITMLKFI